jgi:parallel beta-helix repeat protein
MRFNRGRCSYALITVVLLGNACNGGRHSSGRVSDDESGEKGGGNSGVESSFGGITGGIGGSSRLQVNNSSSGSGGVSSTGISSSGGLGSGGVSSTTGIGGTGSPPGSGIAGSAGATSGGASWLVVGLDSSGASVPDTDYAIPAKAIFMSPGGVDSNPGELATPVRSLNRAIALASAGGTIVLRGGLYRDWYNKNGTTYRIVDKNLTFQAYPHEQPWLDGTDVIAKEQWLDDGKGHYYIEWSTPAFCSEHYFDYPYDAQPTSNSGPCSHYDMYGDPDYPAAGDPQMVFVDGQAAHEVAALDDVKVGDFFYDWNARRLYISINPAGHTIELAARPTALVLGGGATYLVKGIGFRRFATNEYSNITGAALYVGATDSLVENCVFTEMAAGALNMGARRGVVRRSVFAKNGFTAMGSNGHTNSSDTGTDGLLIDSVIVNANNTERFGKNCSRSCAQAGIKIAHMNGFTVRGSIFENNIDAAGFWCDERCKGGVIVNNIVRKNKTGIFYEVSDTGIIASNLIYDNSGNGIQLTSANTKVYNNTLVDNALVAVWVYDDDRSPDDPKGTAIGPDTLNVEVANNILSGGSSILLKASRKSTAGSNTGPDTPSFFTILDSNSYYRRGGASQIIIDWQDPNEVFYKSLSAFRSVQSNWEERGQDLSEGSDPFFVDRQSNDFRIRESSAIFSDIRPLPSDVAAAIGTETGIAFQRGAITWPGRL